MGTYIAQIHKDDEGDAATRGSPTPPARCPEPHVPYRVSVGFTPRGPDVQVDKYG